VYRVGAEARPETPGRPRSIRLEIADELAPAVFPGAECASRLLALEPARMVYVNDHGELCTHWFKGDSPKAKLIDNDAEKQITLGCVTVAW
jgi:hypothetical protein